MIPQFWSELAEMLEDCHGVLATVTETAGSVPRTAGARLFLGSDGRMLGTVGGGAAEGVALEACRELMGRTEASRRVDVDLAGRPGELRDGICGGRMKILVTPLSRNHLPAARQVSASLEGGHSICLGVGGSTALWILSGGETVADEAWVEKIAPPNLLLIAGAGHIGRVLAEWSRRCGFQVGLQDTRAEWLGGAPEEISWKELCPRAAVQRLEAWEGGRCAVLVTRGYLADLEMLRPLLPLASTLRFLGILGSSRRIATLREECRKEGLPDWPPGITHAPVGLSIGAETPEEIAVSLLAQLIQVHRGAVA